MEFGKVAPTLLRTQNNININPIDDTFHVEHISTTQNQENSSSDRSIVSDVISYEGRTSKGGVPTSNVQNQTPFFPFFSQQFWRPPPLSQTSKDTILSHSITYLPSHDPRNRRGQETSDNCTTEKEQPCIFTRPVPCCIVIPVVASELNNQHLVG